MIPLSGPYYVECNEVFRRSTNQSELMLEQLTFHTEGRADLSVVSVGSGAGLFEVPMLRLLGDRCQQFVGVDVNSHACETLQRKLDEEFSGRLAFEVLNQSFQDYQTDLRFDLVLFNHTFEYLDGDRLLWIQKSLDLLDKGGSVLIFSPDRGGINRYYGEVFSPCFSEDLELLLTKTEFDHTTFRIKAECDLSLLSKEDADPDKIRLLSFLTQADCRELSSATLVEIIEYFRSLGNEEGSMIPHPATLFIL